MTDVTASIESSPSRVKRRRIIRLRGLLLFAVGALLFASGGRDAGFGAVTLLVLFGASNVVLLAAPLRLVASLKFELFVGAADLILVATGFYLAGTSGGVLPVSCLLMVMVVALGNYRTHTIAGAAAIGALHAWLVLGSRSSAAEFGQLAVQVLFLCSVALYYGYLAGGIHRARRRVEAEELERRELLILQQILDSISSSLELRAVTQTIVGKITEVIPAIRCSILLINESGTNCFVMASHDNPELNMLQIDLTKYPEVREAIRTRQPVVIQNVSTDPLMNGVADLVSELDFHSIMVVPLTFAGDVLGTLCLKTARADEEFTSNELNFLHAVAKASANALKNALLHHKVCEQSRCHQVVGEKLTSILDNSPDLILTTDNGGHITEFNRGAEKLLGHDKTDMIGRSHTSLLVEESDRDFVEEIRRAGTLSSVELRLRKADGSGRDLETSMALLRNESDEVTGTVWIGRDLGDLKAARAQLMQAEKLSTLGEVISGVAHELNNPLSGVLGYAQLLLMRHADGPFSRELEKINDSASRCQKIVRNLLSFARGHKPERKFLAINEILQKTLDLRRYQLHVGNVEVVTDLDPDLPRTLVDYHQLQQVFLNLINNAQHALAGIRPHGTLLVRTSQERGVIRIEVTDDGEGMNRDTLRRIFDPFFTTKEQGQGTGLGLSVSYGIVKEHGGSITAHSDKGRGTTFTVELPVREPEAEVVKNERSTATNRGSLHGGRILVVDDEPVIIDLLLSVLSEAGYEVDTADNGEQACRKVRLTDYDAIVTDVRMPRMDGMELYREILSMRPGMEGRVIFISGDLIDHATVAFLAGFDGRTIPKPLDLPSLVQAVEDIVDLRPATAASS